MLFYNGNARGQTLVGRTAHPPGTWNHVLFVRDGSRRRLPERQCRTEFAGEADVTAPARKIFSSARAVTISRLSREAWRSLRCLIARWTRSRASSIRASAVRRSFLAARPQTPPLSPEDSLKKIHVPTGYGVELVAAEPLTARSRGVRLGCRGRLWVVEMADYPLGHGWQGPAGGRVRVLEDTDGDGRYDKSTLFADGLNFPTGLLTWRDGVHRHGGAGDPLPARHGWRWQSGFARSARERVPQGNQQLRANGLRWGLDNWVYCAAGGHHGEYGDGTKSFELTGERSARGFTRLSFSP